MGNHVVDKTREQQQQQQQQQQLDTRPIRVNYWSTYSESRKDYVRVVRSLTVVLLYLEVAGSILYGWRLTVVSTAL